MSGKFRNFLKFFFSRAEKKTHDAVESVEHLAHDTVEKAEYAVQDTFKMVAMVEKTFFRPIRNFMHIEASGGIILVITSMIAIIIANTDLYAFYDYLLHNVYFHIGLSDTDGGDFQLKKSLLHVINDGLMAIFFFLIGLEIKREIMSGELSSRDRLVLPALAAVGGMVVPALIYWFLNQGSADNIQGWAIPAATDIAFALAVLSLLGKRAPTSLKILLMAIAVIDDLGAIIIIALFYSADIQIMPLYFAGAAIAALAFLNFRNVSQTPIYIVLGLFMWLAVLESGVHGTLAGVITALFIPLRHKYKRSVSPVKELEHGLHPWVAFGVLPLFGFANAGVPFDGLSYDDLFDPVTLGIILGLFVGKQVGVFGMLWLTIVTGLSPKPTGTNWVQLYAVSVLCGIGFTMSLFIGGLAFSGVEMQASVRLGVIVGSVASALFAYVLLVMSSKKRGVKGGHASKNIKVSSAPKSNPKEGELVNDE